MYCHHDSTASDPLEQPAAGAERGAAPPETRSLLLLLLLLLLAAPTALLLAPAVRLAMALRHSVLPKWLCGGEPVWRQPGPGLQRALRLLPSAAAGWAEALTGERLEETAEHKGFLPRDLVML